MAAGNAATSKRSRARPSQHFLAGRKLAAQFVRQCGIDSGHLVVEPGAGTGLITAELARRAGRVIAVEIDPGLARNLKRQFASDRNVEIRCADFLETDVTDPFRVVGNLPFNETTAILRKILGQPALLRADVIVQFHAAHKRVSPMNLLNAMWGPWFAFELGMVLRRTCFRPAPSVDARHLVITKRSVPLIPDHIRKAYIGFVTDAFGTGNAELGTFLPAQILADNHIAPASRPTDLKLDEFVRLARRLLPD